MISKTVYRIMFLYHNYQMPATIIHGIVNINPAGLNKAADKQDMQKHNWGTMQTWGQSHCQYQCKIQIIIQVVSVQTSFHWRTFHKPQPH